MALFTPALLLEPQLLAVGLAIAFAALLAAEAARVGRMPLIGPRIHSFMTSFIDERDAGLLLVRYTTALHSAWQSKPVHFVSLVSLLLPQKCVVMMGSQEQKKDGLFGSPCVWKGRGKKSSQREVGRLRVGLFVDR